MLVIRQENNSLLLSFMTLSILLAQMELSSPAVAADGDKKISGTFVVAQSKQPPAQNSDNAAKGLHRLDFHLLGVSCATCILAMRTALRAAKGVNRADIALRKPYGGVLIYDPAKTNIKELIGIAEKADKNGKARVMDPVEEPIVSIPLVLVPKYNALQKSDTGLPK